MKNTSRIIKLAKAFGGGVCTVGAFILPLALSLGLTSLNPSWLHLDCSPRVIGCLPMRFECLTRTAGGPVHFFVDLAAWIVYAVVTLLFVAGLIDKELLPLLNKERFPRRLGIAQAASLAVLVLVISYGAPVGPVIGVE